MKKRALYFSYIAAALLVMAGCSKVEPLPYYNDGNQVTLTASKTSVVPTPADSAKEVLTLNWTSPNYASDPNTYKFVVQIDTAGRNFAKAMTKTVTGMPLSTSFTGSELNNLLLNFGFKLGSPVTLDMRVMSSYGNNNERYLSNVVKVAVTPYSDPSTLSSTATTVTPTLPTAADNALTFSWTPSFKGYTGTVTYTLQYDSTGRNFSVPKEMQIGATTYSKTLTQAEINASAIDAGVIGGTTGKVDYRIKATTAQGAVAYSNAVAVTVNTFVPVPDNLYIVGDATPGGWDNPVPTPSQQFTKTGAYTFAITTILNAGKSYLLLPVNGSWDHKFGAATDGTAAGGATLLKDGAVPGSNTPAPATTGVYKIVVNFQTNKITVTPVAIPANLYIVGDATPGGWSNPVPTPAQQFTKVGTYSYAIIVNLTAGKSYLLLPSNGSWDHKYGGTTDGTSGGVLLADGDVPGSNTPAPAESGLYRIFVDFATNTYKVTPVPENLYIVGDATPGGWSNPVPTPAQQFTKTATGMFELTTTLYAGKAYLLLPVNGSWDHKYGGTTDGTSASGGTLLYDGAVPGSNTPAPATTGTYKISVNFLTGTYKVTP